MNIFEKVVNDFLLEDASNTSVNKKKRGCPYCGSVVKYGPRIETDRWGGKREYPTTYACGTVTSPNWQPPIRGKHCKES